MPNLIPKGWGTKIGCLLVSLVAVIRSLDGMVNDVATTEVIETAWLSAAMYNNIFAILAAWTGYRLRISKD